VTSLELLAWDDTGLDLLRAMNTAEQKQHLGGPETEAKMLDRHQRYLTYHRPGETEMLRIAVGGEIVGSIGYWEVTRDGGLAYETGWEIVAARHGRGIGGGAAGALMARLKAVAAYRYVFAFPTPDNPGSNGICRKLGFELVGVEEAEYPKGVWAPHNVWRLDLRTFVPQGP
jgi:RimJ/RimL family protein N-acetyltransferase